MKIINTKNTFFFALLLSIILMSCNKEKGAPTIKIESPNAHSTHKWGETVHIEAMFEDEKELKDYTVFVGNEAGELLPIMDFNVTGTTTGASFEFHDHLIVPTDAPNEAYVHFSVTNKANQTTKSKVMIHFEE